MLFRISQWFKDRYRGISLGSVRSSDWPRVRNQFIKDHPACAVCDRTTKLQVHHKKPFNAFPELELDPNNLMTLCENSGMSCHITFGHLGNFKFYNPNVDEDVKIWREKVAKRLPNK